MKRLVTAIGADGRSRFVMDGEPERVMRLGKLPDLAFAEIWATNAPVDLHSPPCDRTSEIESLVPVAGGTRFRIVTLPPDRELARVLENAEDAWELIAEFRAKAPGIADAGELH